MSAVVLLLACPLAGAQVTGADKDIPVAPIQSAEFRGWTNAFRLSNGKLEVVVVPAVGRVVFLGLNPKENLLRLDAGLQGKTAGKDENAWQNFGGDWLWPVAQSRWRDVQGGDWPPSRLLDGRPWSGRAWKCADGQLCCLMSQQYGKPLSITVSRLLKLSPDQSALTIRQEIRRTANSRIPVTLWNISQVQGAQRVILPVDADSSFPGGTRPLMFGEPGTNVVKQYDGAIVFDATLGGEHKLCGDSGRAWIAAQKNNVILIEHAGPAVPEGAYPDGGCTIEMYSNKGLGYSEIETLSIEKNLAVGETLENTLTITCYRVPDEVRGTANLVESVRALLGEKE